MPDRKYLRYERMQSLAYELPGVEFTTKEFKEHWKKKGYNQNSASTLLFQIKNSGMIVDIGEATDSKNGRRYEVKDVWRR